MTHLRTDPERLAHLEAALSRTDRQVRRLILALSLLACLTLGLAALVLRPP